LSQPLSAGADNFPVEHELMAAVDLGSNSFQLLVASFSHGQLQVVDRIREMVRLAAGLDGEQNLELEIQQRALDCLARFGERLRDIPPDRVRAVGTNTLRKARDPAAFLKQAEALLGHEIDIISGIEEARLIFSGVSRSLPEVAGPHLVIDIGGGSTEVAGGEGYQPKTLQSLYMGCVSMSRAHFPNGKISRKRFDRARTAARLELRPVAGRFRGTNWIRAAGASGTIRAASNVLRELGFADGAITVAALERLIVLMIDAAHVDHLDLAGLSEQRAVVFPGGVAILVEVLQELGINELVTTQGALREGIIYDLVGRLSDEDSRVRTVRAMEARYHVDQAQANRVETTALSLFVQVEEKWQLQQPNTRNLMVWSARLHEIGLDIAHAQYHQHGAYLLQHADMPGFNRKEQSALAAVVGAHRRKMTASRLAEAAPKSGGKRAQRLAILLRLAVLFNRSRTAGAPEIMRMEVDGRTIQLSLSKGWLAASPLTLADLEGEKAYLFGVDYELQIEPVNN
jgi:exopolyphosphatase/guanosine-5'-triphosphate,3'-diphosphate pyrophosphatase